MSLNRHASVPRRCRSPTASLKQAVITATSTTNTDTNTNTNTNANANTNARYTWN